MADHLERAAHYRLRAERCRRRATDMTEAEHRLEWIELAEEFERLAEEVEQLHEPA